MSKIMADDLVAQNVLLSGTWKVIERLAMFPASRWSPTFTSVLSMLCDGFLEFLSIVYNSFQRHTLIIFVRGDVNGRIMLKKNRRTTFALFLMVLFYLIGYEK